MTYAAQAKNELARRELGDPCCQKAELTALIRYSGNMQVSAQRLALHVITSNPAIARRIFSLFKHTFHLNSELLVRRKIRLRKNNVYLIRIKERERVLEILRDLRLNKRRFFNARAECRRTGQKMLSACLFARCLFSGRFGDQS